MVRPSPAVALLLASGFAAPAADLDPVLERVSEEAEAFGVSAQRMVATEILRHHGLKSPPRFRPRVGAAALGPIKVPMVTREIVSEFGYAAMRDSPRDLREFRKIIQVDGKAVKNASRARLELASNMTSDDDRRRKKMLQDFEHLGMVGAATDFSQIILLFRRENLSRYEFRYSARNRIGDDPVSVLVFRQKPSGDGARVFHDKEMEVVPLEGEIWVRDSDSRPLRIVTRAVTKEYGLPVLHAAETEYKLTRTGTLAPASVRYTRTQGEDVTVENIATYTAIQVFSVDTEIKFTPEEESPPPPGPQ